MNKKDYMKNVKQLQEDGRRNNLISFLILSVFVLPFTIGILYLLLYVFTNNEKISLALGIIISIIGMIIMYHISNKKDDQNVLDIYAKEIPVSCPSCGAPFSVIAGNSEPCPYCGANILVNNQGKIIKSETKL